MTFVHDDPEFPDLLRIVGSARGLASGLVEKDYWVTHSLWALHDLGLDVWFKGGTSLSKGFGLIRRFSEDLDLKLEPGSLAAVPAVSNWTSEGVQATAARAAYFDALEGALDIPGAHVALDREQADRSHRSALFQVRYPGAFLDDLGGVLRPFVLLEVRSARVTPFVERDVGSFVHEHLAETGVTEFEDNRARAVRCIHPLVTLLEKLDALSRRFSRAEQAAATFVRHYEDAAHIIAGIDELPGLETTPRELAEEMVGARQLRAAPTATDPALTVSDSPAWQALRRAHQDIGPTFWGDRVELADACSAIRAWVVANLERPT